MSDLNVPFNSHGLKDSEISLLTRGNLQTVADLVLTSTQDIAKRCRASPIDIKRLVNTVLAATQTPELKRLDNCDVKEEIFTTGNKTLDDSLGGGIRTGMLWEVVGESAAGKTQFALQLSLSVQGQRELGGLEASACYITTSAALPTARLLQISRNHVGLVSSSCSLEHIHTLSAPTVALLQHVLADMVPSFLQEQKAKQKGRPVKLLVIDALAELFHTNDKTSKSTLVQRSRDIIAISTTLHRLAKDHKLAILVLNEVNDSFERPNYQLNDLPGLSYNYQSRLFNTSEFFGERGKEATLGLVWANQVNTRIMLSRTGRRRYLQSEELPKRLRLDADGGPTVLPSVLDEQQSTLIRRLCVIFSNSCLPFSLDYIVMEGGVFALPEKEQSSVLLQNKVITIGHQSSVETSEKSHKVCCVQNQKPTPTMDAIQSRTKSKLVEEENDDYLWEHEDAYEDLDWDALEEALSQAPIKDSDKELTSST